MSTADGTLTSGNSLVTFASPTRQSDIGDKEQTNAGRPCHSAALPTCNTGGHGNPIEDTSKSLVSQTSDQRQPLGAVPVVFDLPMDHRPSNGLFYSEAFLQARLEDPLKAQLSSLAHDYDSDLPTAVLVAWIIVLSRLSDQEDIVLSVCGSFGKETFTSPQALNVDLSGDLDASKLFERTKHTLKVANNRQSIVNDPINPSENGDIPALSQAGFYSHTGGLAQPSNHHGTMECLELHLFHDKEDITMGIRYAADLFNMDTIERYIWYIKAVLTNMVTDKGQPVALFDILSPEEKRLLIETWNETDAEYPAERCAHHLFEDQVDKSPYAVAIVHGKKELTYLELNAMANRLARQIAQAGIDAGDFVALLFERSIELVVSELAVLKAGAAYVPIDTRTPADRLAFILSDTASKLLLTSEDTKVSDHAIPSVLRFSADKEAIGHEQDLLENPHHTSTSSLNTAYILFTSGSTGIPKGVVVPHRAFIRAVINNGYAKIGPADRVAMAANPTFATSILEVWSALLNGARLIIIDDDTKLNADRLAEAIVRYNVTCLSITPSLLLQYAPTIGKTLSQLRYLFFGGEQVQAKGYLSVHQHEGPVRLLIRYGSTEAICPLTYTTSSTINQLGRSPIGRPTSNVRVYVLDNYRNPVPLGVVGELYIGGPGIATGYLNRPDLTVERFLPDPYSNVQGARMYKSGDLARYLPDGNLVFFGRNDDLVKIRAYRIELGEIQARLVEHPLVRNAAVLVVDMEGDRQLVAYAEAEFHERLDDTLREHLARMLPHYMIPAAFVCMDSLPLTSRGKIDRRALPEPNRESIVKCDYVVPQGELEVALAKIWSDLLKVDRVGRHDNFFMLGGHSLLAVRLISIVRSSLGADLELHMLFSAPTLSALALHLDGTVGSNAQGHEYSVLIPLQQQGSRPPLFCVHSGVGVSWSFKDLAKYLHPEQPLYGLQSRGLDGKSPLATSIEDMTLDYIHQIRKVQSRGPYHLLGWSFGGKIAHNMAAVLQSQGESVPLLVIMDTQAVKPKQGDGRPSVQDESTSYDEYLTRLLGAYPLDDALALKSLVAPIFDNNRSLLEHFKPSVYSGDILFFRATAEENVNLIDPTCWIPYIRGNVEVHDVDCAHVEMDRPEHLAVVGRIVEAWLEKEH
ncbi:unnamed protein product [Mortierella alpina]